MVCNHYTCVKPKTLWISMIVTDTASYGQVSFLTWTQVRKLGWWARLTQVAKWILSPGWPAPPELPAKCFQQRVSWKNRFLLNFFRGTCSYWPILWKLPFLTPYTLLHFDIYVLSGSECTFTEVITISNIVIFLCVNFRYTVICWLYQTLNFILSYL